MDLDRRTLWLVLACTAVTAGLIGPTMAVRQALPSPVALARVSLARALTRARNRVSGGQLLMGSPTVRHGRTGYLFSFRKGGGHVVAVWVDAGSGQSNLVRSPKPDPAARVGPAADSSSIISAHTAAALALRAVGGDQVLWVHRSEPNDRGTWYYRAKVLLQDSSDAIVEVSPFGQVLSVHTASRG